MGKDVIIFIKKWSDPNLKDKNGDTVLHLIISRPNLRDKPYNYMPNEDTEYIVDLENSLKFFVILVSNGADINIQNNEKNIPLYKIHLEYFKFLKILIDKFVTSEYWDDLYIYDDYKKKPIFYEKYRDNYYDFYQCFQYLINQGSDINIINNSNENFISMLLNSISFIIHKKFKKKKDKELLFTKNLEIIKLILDNKVDISFNPEYPKLFPLYIVLEILEKNNFGLNNKELEFKKKFLI